MIIDPQVVHCSDVATRNLMEKTRRLAIEHRLRSLIAAGHLCLPSPGSGATWQRLRRLAEIAAEDLSLARLAEGHTDGLAILSEAGLTPESETAVLGVWVAGPALQARPDSGISRLRLQGTREYCSGAGIVQLALTVGRLYPGEGNQLFTVAAADQSVIVDEASWPAIGMADSKSYTIRFDETPTTGVVGPPGFYQDRAGFWNGSANVAACWYGGALGIVRRLHSERGSQKAGWLYSAELMVALSIMRETLVNTARAIDLEPHAEPRIRELRALFARDVIYRGCNEVVGAALELGGTHFSTHNARQARALADLPIYLRQFSPRRDRERLGALLVAGGDSKGQADDRD